MCLNSKMFIALLTIVSSLGGYLLIRQLDGTLPTIRQTFDNQSHRAALDFEQGPNEGPGPLLDLSSLTQQADLIVVGQIVSLRDQGRKLGTTKGLGAEGRRIAATLNVTRTLKGPGRTGLLEFETFAPAVNSGYAVVRPKQFGMFFLRKENGMFAVLSPYYPFVIAPHQAHEFAGGDLDRVVEWARTR